MLVKRRKVVKEMEQLPERHPAPEEEPIVPGIAIVDDIATVKARLTELDHQIAKLSWERHQLAFKFNIMLQKNAGSVPTENQDFQRAVYAEDMSGPGITGFENSPMRNK